MALRLEATIVTNYFGVIVKKIYVCLLAPNKNVIFCCIYIYLKYKYVAQFTDVGFSVISIEDNCKVFYLQMKVNFCNFGNEIITSC